MRSATDGAREALPERQRRSQVSESPGATESPAAVDRRAVSDAELGAVASERVEVYVLDGAGNSLLDPAKSEVSPELLFWLRLRLVEGTVAPHALPASATVLRANARRSRSEPGWYTEIDRPARPSLIALCFGGHILRWERILPGEASVQLRVTRADIEALRCTAKGTVPGLAGSASLVRVTPIEGTGAPAVPILGIVEGDAFTVAGIPPGAAILDVRLDQAALAQAMVEAAAERSIGPVALGAQAANEEQWNLRLDVLSSLQPAYARIELELAPGEVRSLGDLSLGQSAAVHLTLMDGEGAPVDARSVDVVQLGRGAAAPTIPTTWTFENHAFVHPLPAAPTELSIVQNSVGALVRVDPTALTRGQTIPPVDVQLTPLALIRLPSSGDGGDAVHGLSTEAGLALRPDPRWAGGSYRGHSVGESVLIVPAGRYRLTRDGQPVGDILDIEPDTFVDATHDEPRAESLGRANFKGSPR